jgi:hypothetical protein
VLTNKRRCLPLPYFGDLTDFRSQSDDDRPTLQRTPTVTQIGTETAIPIEPGFRYAATTASPFAHAHVAKTIIMANFIGARKARVVRDCHAPELTATFSRIWTEDALINHLAVPRSHATSETPSHNSR